MLSKVSVFTDKYFTLILEASPYAFNYFEYFCFDNLISNQARKFKMNNCVSAF